MFQQRIMTSRSTILEPAYTYAGIYIGATVTIHIQLYDYYRRQFATTA